MAEVALNELSEVLKKMQENLNESKNFHIASFDEENESFDSYLQRLENYFSFKNIRNESDVEDKRCVQIFLNCLSPKMYHILSSLTAPDLPNSRKFNDLKSLLRAYISPCKSEVAEQNRFISRIQKEGESIAQFQAGLRQLSINCNFNCSNCKKSTVDSHLRIQFIRGVRDNNIREKLLQENREITFEEAVKVALAVEAAKKESNEIQDPGSSAPSSLHKLEKSKTVRNFDKKGEEGARKPSYSWKGEDSSVTRPGTACYRCGSRFHWADNCEFKNSICSFCNKKGHRSTVCRQAVFNNKKYNKKEQKQLEIDQSDTSDDSLNSYSINFVKSLKLDDRFLIKIEMDNIPVTVEIDTGAKISSISFKLFNSLFPNKKILKTNIKLKTYKLEVFEPLGISRVSVKAAGLLINDLNIFVIDDDVDFIMGREWIRKFGLIELLRSDDQHKLLQLSNYEENRSKILKQKLTNEFSETFVEKVGTIPNFKASLILREGTKPIFIKPRPIPFAIREKVEEELKRLEKDGIIERVVHSDWGSPVVPIFKDANNIRLCADFKTTINKYLVNDKYPIPRIDEIFSKMSKGKYFTTLDICKAYLHLEMDESSSLIQTISTHKGSFKVKKLMFGVKNAPSIWQRFMDQILGDVEGVACFFDDIIIQGSTLDEAYDRTREVLKILCKNNLHLKIEKCKFFQREIQYLGHMIDENGLHKVNKKIKAIADTRPPTNISELRQFLGMVNYYIKFIPRAVDILFPLTKLLRKENPFNWSRECSEAFVKIKEELMSDRVLIPYNPEFPLILTTDASPCGISAILSHKMKDGSERPIHFVSRTLSKSERNYSQILKEATAIYWALHKFFKFCYGRKFTLVTDNKPLTAIFNPNKELPSLTAARMLNYAQFLSGFNYEIKFKTSEENSNADYFSRFPVNSSKVNVKDNLEKCLFQLIEERMPITFADVARETLKDEELKQLYFDLLNGEITNVNFKKREAEFTIHEKCLFLGERLVIPKSLRETLKEELHETHIGITKMKLLARNYCWWPGINKDIELIAGSCKECNFIQKEPAKVPVHRWECPDGPWKRIHIDYAGPFMNNYFLIVVDAYSKWLEVIPLKSITSKKTIESLTEIFSRWGLPEIIVSDNGTSFTSFEFKEFLKKNCIKHKLIAPGHPATNGQAERYVQTIKYGLKSMDKEKGDLKEKLNKLLLINRKVVNCATGESPANRMLKFEIRTKIDFLKPSKENIKNQFDDEDCNLKHFKDGERIIARNYGTDKEKWKLGTVERREGKLHYWIRMDGSNKVWRRHVDQMRKTNVNKEIDYANGKEDMNIRYPVVGNHIEREILAKYNQPKRGGQMEQEIVPEQMTVQDNIAPEQIAAQDNVPERLAAQDFAGDLPVLRRSTRVRQPPRRYNN